MATPRFAKDGSTLDLDGLVYPVKKPRQKIQVTDRTAAGTLQVEDLGVSVRSFPLSFANMSADCYASLVTWWNTTADGAVNTFTFSDEDGDSYTVRMLTNPLNFAKNRGGRYSGQLMLEVAD